MATGEIKLRGCLTMDRIRLAETEGAVARTDRLWRSEMKRLYGPDGVIAYGFGREGRGEPGSRIHEAFEARQQAIAAWRHVRRPEQPSVR